MASRMTVLRAKFPVQAVTGRTGAVLSLTEDPTLRSSSTVIDPSRDEHKQPEWLKRKPHEGNSN